MNESTPPGASSTKRPWDRGSGLFGRWDPLAGYDGIPPDPSDPADVDRFVRDNRLRLLGGGPAALGRDARTFGIDCGRCHVAGASDVQASDLPFGAYPTATLGTLGLVTLESKTDGSIEVRWDPSALLADGTIRPDRFPITAPTSEVCGTCHGLVKDAPELLRKLGTRARMTLTTGQLFAATRMRDSTWNISDRSSLPRAWDVHAERLLECSDCHFSPNDPGATFRKHADVPTHLRHDSRTLGIGAFLHRPSHEFAKGSSTQGKVDDPLDGGMRRCEDCHDAKVAHPSLPKAQRHLERLSCESCHVSKMVAPAYRVRDYTVIDELGNPRVEYRGDLASASDPAAYVRATEPLLLGRKDENGRVRLYPYNVVTSFYWTVETPAGLRPATIEQLRRALYQAPGAATRLTSLLDSSRNGIIEDAERHLASVARVEGVRALLLSSGARNPQLKGEMQAYGIHHGIGDARFALRDCDQCHSSTSRLTQPFILARSAPFGLTPSLLPDNDVIPAFSVASKQGERWLVPNLEATSLHVSGTRHGGWMDGFGISLISLTALGALGHGLLRMRANSRRRKSK
jgi:hypothetical protein